MSKDCTHKYCDLEKGARSEDTISPKYCLLASKGCCCVFYWNISHSPVSLGEQTGDEEIVTNFN